MKMLGLKEKLEQCEQFTRGETFGMHTWLTIYLFSVNVKNILSTIELYGVVIKRFDEGNIPNDLTPSQHLRVKQHIMLDIVMKVQILIESTLMLLYALSSGYRHVAETMTYYDFNQVKKVIEKTRNEDFNMRRALGLPKICNLPLSKAEQKVLAEIYAETERSVWQALKKIIDFYDKFKIIYGKSKHGLIFQTGGGLNTGSNTPNFDGSFAIAYDRKSRKDMPRGYFTAKAGEPIVSEWFSAVSQVAFGPKLIDEISTMMSGIKELVTYLFDNHKTYAMNCGESTYLIE